MWWLTLTACDGEKIHVPLALILRISEVRKDEKAPAGSLSKLTFAGGSIQYLAMRTYEVIETEAWKWRGVK
jgi:hypothetical protein